jgi:hypothetical protein
MYDRTKDFPILKQQTSVRLCTIYLIKNPNFYNFGKQVVAEFVPNK